MVVEPSDHLLELGEVEPAIAGRVKMRDRATCVAIDLGCELGWRQHIRSFERQRCRAIAAPLTYIVMAYIVMAYVVMTYVVMALLPSAVTFSTCAVGPRRVTLACKVAVRWHTPMSVIRSAWPMACGMAYSKVCSMYMACSMAYSMAYIAHITYGK